MKNTKVSKVMLSTLVTGALLLGMFVVAILYGYSPYNAKEETQIDSPSSALVSALGENRQLVKDIEAEGIRLELERIEEARLVEVARLAEQARIAEQARVAEEARIAKIEFERKAKEEASVKARVVEQKKQSQSKPSTKGVAFNASYYTAYCTGCSGITREGHNARKSIYSSGMRVIATDPSVIPMHSIVEVSTPYETFKAIALDTGGAIKGHKVDILVADKQTAYSLGRHTVHIKVLRSGK